MRTYTVSIRRQEFVLSEDQIQFDAPNFFSNCFLGDFNESQTGTVELHRNPSLFAIIVEYLSGYEILPLSEKAIPLTMTRETALRNLAADALFYGFQNLHARLVRPSVPAVFRQYEFSDMIIPFDDVLKGRLPPSVQYHDSGLGTIDSDTWIPVLIRAEGLALQLAITVQKERSVTPLDIDDLFLRSSLTIYLPVDHATLLLSRDARFDVQDPEPGTRTSTWRINEPWDDRQRTRMTINDLTGDIESIERWAIEPFQRTRWRDRPELVHNEAFVGELFGRKALEADPEPPFTSTSRRALIIADEIIFTLPSRPNLQSHNAWKLTPRVLSVKGRTLHAAFQDLSPPVSTKTMSAYTALAS